LYIRYAIVDARAMVKVAKLGDTAAAEANHVRAGRIQRWAAFLSKLNAIVVHWHCPQAMRRVPTRRRPSRKSSQQQRGRVRRAGRRAASGATCNWATPTNVTTGDISEYRKARVTPLDWPAYKWPAVAELAAAQEAALAGQDAHGVDLTQVPEELRKWAKDDIVLVLGSETLTLTLNAHAHQ
jgi:hypothetical protein